MTTTCARKIGAMVLSLLGAACAEPNAPAHAIQSLYVAQSVNGVSLPVELYTVGTVRRFLDASSVAFETGNEARRIQTIRSVDASQPSVPQLSTDTTFYDLAIRGDTAWLYARCYGPTATCVAPTMLLRDGDGYTQLISYDPLQVLRFVRS